MCATGTATWRTDLRLSLASFPIFRVRIAPLLVALLVLIFAVVAVSATANTENDLSVANVARGHQLFTENCAACHSDPPTGKGDPANLGFPAGTFNMPDFADCDFAVREADSDWLSSIHRGGRARAFPREMPAWDKALTEDQMASIVAYMRGFCAGKGYPRGEFNFPLATFTEKAFPEDEAYVKSQVATSGKVNTTINGIFEKRVGKRGQFEINVPYVALADDNGVVQKGVGDIGLSWKQVIHANVDTGSIVSLYGEVVLPTGSESRGLGSGVTTLEGHLLFGKILPSDFFLQGDVVGIVPTGHGLPASSEAHFSIGRSFAADQGWGRLFTPQLEILTARDFTSGAPIDVDIVPQFNVTLSRRQHIQAAIGERIPLNDRGPNRQPAFVAYLIWDWYDGGLFSGW